MTNAEAFIAQRRALVDYLRALPDEAWTDDVRTRVDELVAAYREALAGTADETTAEADAGGRGGTVDDLERVAAALESTYAQQSHDRWDGPTDALRTRHPIGIGVQTLMYDVHRRAQEIATAAGRPFQPPADVTKALAAAVVWRVSGHVEVPVRVVIGDDEYMLGGGEPEGTLHTDHDGLVAVATGHAAPEQLGDRWRVEGSDDVREAVARTFSADWGDPEVSITER
jgi:hypothetical protein